MERKMPLSRWKLPTCIPLTMGQIVLKVVVLLVQTGCCYSQVSAEIQSSFKIVAGYRLATGATQTNTFSHKALTLMKCGYLCRDDCGMFEYSKTHNVCTTFQERNYDAGFRTVADPDWSWGYKRLHRTITHGDWTLVFRAQSKIGIGAYETWNDTQATTDNPVNDRFPHACLRLVDYAMCKRHFRSHIIDKWENIDKVKLSFVSNGNEVAFILFDGAGSNKDSWFSQTRIIASSWPLLPLDDTVHIFDLFGYKVNPKLWRTFLIFGPKVICNLDTFYTMVIDQSSDSCAVPLFWNIEYSGFPAFYYSGMPDSAHLFTVFSAHQYREADVLAISVTFMDTTSTGD